MSRHDRWGYIVYDSPTASRRWGLALKSDDFKATRWFKTQKALLQFAHESNIRPGCFAVARFTDDFRYNSERGFKQ